MLTTIVSLKTLIREGLGSTVYHGRCHYEAPKLSSLNARSFFHDMQPAWFTFNKSDAQWYAYDGCDDVPCVFSAIVAYTRPASEDDIERIASRLGLEITHSDTTRQSPDNPNDVLYDKRLLAALEGEGFDAFIGSDELNGDFVDVLVVWRVAQVQLNDVEVPKEFAESLGLNQPDDDWFDPNK